MPYICLARGDIPDSVVQVLDLLPNSSQRIPSLTPPGESRYVNRVKRGTANITSTGVLSAQGHLDGLEAYLLDRVDPGGLEQAAGTITILAGLAAGDTITLNGVVFTAINGVPNPAAREFRDVAGSLSIANTITTLVAAIVHADSIAAMKLGTITGSYVHAVAASPAVTLTARTGAGVALYGWQGNVTVATSGATVTGASITAGRLTRTHETWTPATQSATADAIVARLDAGLPLALANINTVLLANAGAELTNAGGSQSIGTVIDILACLAGRTFRAPVKDTTGRAASANVDANRYYRYMNSTYPTFRWHATNGRGGFTQFVLNNGSGMSDGEIKPTTIGGDTENREVGGIRHTYNVDALTASLVVGQLSKMTASTLLWPSTNIFPHFPFGQAGFTEYDPTTAPRLVVVYDDAGAVL
jgi:hypothetical protein